MLAPPAITVEPFPLSFYAVFYAARGILAYLREALKAHKGATWLERRRTVGQ